ncbi:MAG: hypothetical protein ACMX3H_02315 [Sodalis sp. (in: enterobacteria)]|uniref:hypothetical protein n=1 Tax=Sodalis sp. (in: enterobacteria) TaxID=1898979 RepID=UPI0039E281AF
MINKKWITCFSCNKCNKRYHIPVIAPFVRLKRLKINILLVRDDPGKRRHHVLGEPLLISLKINHKDSEESMNIAHYLELQSMKKGRLEGLMEGMRKGMLEGMDKGRLEGKKEGRRQATLSIATHLLACGVDRTLIKN